MEIAGCEVWRGGLCYFRARLRRIRGNRRRWRRGGGRGVSLDRRWRRGYRGGRRGWGRSGDRGLRGRIGGGNGRQGNAGRRVRGRGMGGRGMLVGRGEAGEWAAGECGEKSGCEVAGDKAWCGSGWKCNGMVRAGSRRWRRRSGRRLPRSAENWVLSLQVWCRGSVWRASWSPVAWYQT
jgi:hypothetical protein